ncbi:hypothetical protein [Saccharicrinis aurantiacus]|uniref:hypothetical protein n=1 Tax=Saccharicrinis aurantiacus TaxID=1849719 RepID=UPI0015C528B3|nr:hypothetical protein [Saccharicrinis aurantiacus]
MYSYNFIINAQSIKPLLVLDYHTEFNDWKKLDEPKVFLIGLDNKLFKVVRDSIRSQ